MKPWAKSNINTPEYWNGVYRNEQENARQRVDTERLEAIHRWIRVRFEELERLPSMLDVGCGLGDVSQYFLRHYPQMYITGVDLSYHAIDYCRQNVSGSHVNYQVAKADELPFESGKYDMVWCGETLEHTDDPDKTILGLSRVCGEGGLIVLSTPYRQRNVSPEHVWEFEPMDVCRWGNMVGDMVFLDCRLLQGWYTMFAVLRNDSKLRAS